MKEGRAGSEYRTFPGAFLSSICSLLSGASIGPEGTLSTLVTQIAIWIRTKMRIVRDSHDTHLGFDVAALASAFNGVIGSPVFTGVLATEFQIGKKIPTPSSSGTWSQVSSGISSTSPSGSLPLPT
jgi:H+/Cl- antiporter ClcA